MNNCPLRMSPVWYWRQPLVLYLSSLPLATHSGSFHYFLSDLIFSSCVSASSGLHFVCCSRVIGNHPPLPYLWPASQQWHPWGRTDVDSSEPVQQTRPLPCPIACSFLTSLLLHCSECSMCIPLAFIQLMISTISFHVFSLWFFLS